jgi:uncharacterized repeat protein (TIGR03803 family)
MPAVLSGFLLVAIAPAGAQTETVLYSFAGYSGPGGGLIMDKDGNLYGTTPNGGAHGSGTVYKVTPTGEESVLYSLGSHSGDGTGPEANLFMNSEGDLYSTTSGAARITLPGYSSNDTGPVGRLVRKGGLEPPRVSPPDPKSGASANSATFAHVAPEKISRGEPRAADAMIVNANPRIRDCVRGLRRLPHKEVPLKPGLASAVGAGAVLFPSGRHSIREPAGGVFADLVRQPPARRESPIFLCSHSARSLQSGMPKICLQQCGRLVT